MRLGWKVNHVQLYTAALTYEDFSNNFMVVDAESTSETRLESDLSLNPIEYQHSSARFYLTGEHNYPVTNFMELDDVDLTKKLYGG